MSHNGWLLALRSEVLGHPVVRHPLLLAFEGGEIGLPAAQRFGLAYYPHILRTRLDQAAALSVCPDERLQGALAEILWDEYGQGAPGSTHPEQYRRFLRALGLDATSWDRAPLLPALERYQATTRELVTGPWLGAVAVAGLAMEWPIPAIYGALVGGLQRLPGLSPPDLEIFTGHMVQDERHAGLVHDALAPHTQDPAARAQVRHAVMASLDARADWMTGLQHEVLG